MTIDWWHIQNTDPMKTIWKQAADSYMASHPNVKIKITVLENEAFKAKLTTNMQAGNPPDIFQSWGGGTLKEQAEAGLIKDITGPSESWIGSLNEAAVGLYQVDDKQYGVPFNLGMVGVWYNKSLFKKAGIDAPPSTWSEFLADVEKLKSAGITPIAVGEKDKWPGMFWWANLSLRVAGSDAMTQAGEDGSFDSEGFVKAGEELKKLIDMEPFQKSFLAAPWPGANGEAGTMAKRGAAMDLMGQWAPNEFAANTKDKKGLGDDLGWFPFPQVEGGAGEEGEQFGGGDGFAIGKDAPDEAVDFVKYLSSKRDRHEDGRERRDAAGHRGHRELGQGSEHEGRARRARRGVVRAALPRPGVRAGGRVGDQRRGAGALRGQGLSAGGLREDRGCRQGRIARSSSRQGAGRVARPAPLRVRGARAGSRASRCSCCRRWCSTRCW